MTTAEINEKIEDLTTEVRGLKTHNTRLSKALIKAGIEVPIPKWKELESDDQAEEKD
ncbi:MAG: hypothetical protein ACI8ZM_002485 [Crocinitomix sp.]|jgi:hypothetical protein